MHIFDNNVDECAESVPLPWFALRVKSNFEKTVAEVVNNKGFEGFLPLCRASSRWSDRFKLIEAPLFPGYIFCRVDPNLRLPILSIPGVLHFVGIGRVPAPVDDCEVAAIQKALRSGIPSEPWEYLNVGQLVRLDKGPLTGLEGILVKAPDQCRVVVSIGLLHRSVAVEVESTWVTPLGLDRCPQTKPVPWANRRLAPSDS